MGKLYNRLEWKAFRAEVMELDGHCCQVCHRSEAAEVVLQVHHVVYHKGKLPWEYPTGDCKTLCSGCHAREHGVIRPATGWDLVSQEDLGNRSGTCDVCHAPLRYLHHVDHPKWESVSVGTICCDRMTGTEEASAWKKSVDRRSNFLRSKHWKESNGCVQIKRSRMNIEIRKEDSGYRIHIQGKRGSVLHESVDSAKSVMFERIEDGTAEEALRDRGIALDKITRKPKPRSD